MRRALAIVPLLGAMACNALIELPDPQADDHDASTPQPEAAMPDAGIDSSLPQPDAADGDASVDNTAPDAPSDADASLDAPHDADAALGPRPVCDGGVVDTDASNCGFCGHACGAGVACVGGVCRATAIVPPHGGYQGINSLAPVGDNLYFTTWCGPPPAHSTRIAGGGPITDYGGTSGCAGAIEHVGDNVTFVVLRSASPVNTSDLISVPVNGIDATLLLTGVVDQIWSYAFDDTTLFYTTGWKGARGIFSVARGGPPTDPGTQLLAQNDVESIALQGDNVYFAHGANVSVVPKAGGSATVLYTGVAPVQVAADATSIYWAENAGSSIMRGKLDGSSPSPEKIAAGLPGHPSQLILDERSAYFVVGSTIYGVDKDGTTFRTYASWDSSEAGADVPTSLAVDDKYVYWGRSVTNPASIWRVAK